jgi:hypothetical protein
VLTVANNHGWPVLVCTEATGGEVAPERLGSGVTPSLAPLVPDVPSGRRVVVPVADFWGPLLRTQAVGGGR